MRTPEIVNENGTFRFDLRARQWICVRTNVPEFHPHCYVPLEHATSLDMAAREAGFTPRDFGVMPEKPKRTRVPKVPGVKTSRKRKNNSGMKMLIILE